MTSFTDIWTTAFEAKPADTNALSEGAARMRELRLAIRERLAVDHSIAGDSSDGEHLKLSFFAPIVKPTSAANKGFLYMKDVSSKGELFYLDEDGNELQLTSVGKLSIPINSIDGTHIAMGSDAKGDILVYNGTDYIRLAVGTNDQIVKAASGEASGIKWAADAGLTSASLITAGTKLIINPYATSSSASQAHGLSQEPDWLRVIVECLTADANYSTGDRVLLANGVNSAVSSTFSIISDATNIALRTHSSNRPAIINKTSASAANITAANWKMEVTPYKFAAGT